jgi:hypothetical protein
MVLGRVAALVKQFVRTASLNRGLSEVAASAAGGKIFTFGSYRLGVHGPGSDIDTLCVVPKHVSRDDFFDVFEPMLRALEGATEVAVSVFTLDLSGSTNENLATGRSRSLRSHHQGQDIWYPFRFYNGAPSTFINTG